MKKILIIGAGLSSSSLIKYLLDHSTANNWKIRLADVSLSAALDKINHHPNAEAIEFDISNEFQKEEEIKNADAVISMLPASFHPLVAKCCLKYKVHMLTASYVSNEIKAMNEEAKNYGIAMLNELGVDPGIDHMSAMKVIDKIKAEGGRILSFKSSTGGLIAPEYDNNPWNYKFTWNPRNVVVAGQGVSQYIINGDYKYLPYHQLFDRVETTSVPGLGEFEVYPNRDSLKYRETYDLFDIPTMFRGTMRRPGFCKAWNVFVQLGMTDDTYIVENSENLTYRQFINLFLNYDKNLSIEEKIAIKFNINKDSDIMYRLKWLGLFGDTLIGMKNATPAQILQKILVDKWVLEKDDKDLIVMQHQFEYEKSGKKFRITSSLVVIGIDTLHTAMAITVGTPLAIATKLLLTGQINITGVHIPVKKELYEPILAELESYGIKFIEEEIEL